MSNEEGRECLVESLEIHAFEIIFYGGKLLFVVLAICSPTNLGHKIQVVRIRPCS